jgi:hypothetical protein
MGSTRASDAHAWLLTCMLTPHARLQMYLATIQAVAYGTRHIIDALEKAGHKVSRVSACGGGTKNEVWLQVLDLCRACFPLDAWFGACESCSSKAADKQAWLRIESGGG